LRATRKVAVAIEIEVAEEVGNSKSPGAFSHGHYPVRWADAAMHITVLFEGRGSHGANNAAAIFAALLEAGPA
jgi:hypothetical protein